MFTGLVEEVGTVRSVEGDDRGARLTFGAAVVTDGTALGDSIAVSGACLTVVAIDDTGFAVDVVAESLRRTTLGALSAGDPVNLERAVAVGTRLGGHIVQGHVDGTGVVTALTPDGDGVRMSVAVPPEIHRYVVEKGSVTVDGVSLTNASRTADGFQIALIPHTLAVTTLGRRAPGDRVNIEADMVAKYVESLVTPYRPENEQ